MYVGQLHFTQTLTAKIAGELGVNCLMRIEELHKILHPKLGPYSKGRERYTHRLGSDMSVSLEKISERNWEVSIMERGVSEMVSKHKTEKSACEALLKIANED